MHTIFKRRELFVVINFFPFILCFLWELSLFHLLLITSWQPINRKLMNFKSSCYFVYGKSTTCRRHIVSSLEVTVCYYWCFLERGVICIFETMLPEIRIPRYPRHKTVVQYKHYIRKSSSIPWNIWYFPGHWEL